MASRSRQVYPAYPPIDYGPSAEASGSRLSTGVKTAGIAAGVGVGVPGLLYARGLRKMGVPGVNIPGAFLRDVASLRSHEVAPGKFAHGTLGNITGTMREGLTGTGGDISGAVHRVWENLKSAGRGFRAPKKFSSRMDNLVELNVRLDGIIKFGVRGFVQDEVNDDGEKRRFTAPKVGALLGAGAITGAGIATGSVATRSALTALGKKVRAAIDRQIVVQIKRPRR